jgi:predicted dehydrogenase
MSDLRAAIIGYGLAGSVFHAPLIEAAGGLAVALVVTSDPERAAKARGAHPGAEVVATVDEALERADDLDLAVVATANDSHVAVADRALDAGLAVVVDKPLAPDPGAAADLVRRAEALGLPLTAFMNRRWDSDQLTLRRLLAEDRLGTVLRHESRIERWEPTFAEWERWRQGVTPEQGGGVLLDLGSHLIDQALVLFGPVERVYAELDHRRDGPADDDAFVALRHASGTLTHIWCSSFAAVPGPRLRVLGDRAGFVVTDADGQEQALLAGRRPDRDPGWGVEPHERWGRIVDASGSDAVESERGDWPDFYRRLVLTLTEGAPPPVDPRDAIPALEVIEAARRSASGGRIAEL